MLERTIRFDSIGGASGDMILSSLAGLNLDTEQWTKTLRSLPIEDFDIKIEKVSRDGLSGTTINIVTPETGSMPHRHLKDILSILNKSGLPDKVKDESSKIFHRLALAEAEVHGVTPEEVHFHEVGAVDTIVDVTAAVLALEMLNVKGVMVPPLPVGCGTVSCAHGLLPVPAPATAILLKNHPVIPTNEPNEMVTPTGAAILMEWKNSRPSEGGPFNVIGTSQGFGRRELSNRPNMVRAILMEGSSKRKGENDSCLVMECNIDDTVPELLGSLCAKLINDGALDVFTTPVQMKKQRPGTLLTVLCRPENRDSFLNVIFSETTTFGVREHLTERTILARRHIEAKTSFGTVRVKVGTWKEKDITFSPEHDDCVRLAEKNKVSVREVYEQAMRSVKST